MPVDATSVRFKDKPLEKDIVFADLRNGRAFKVVAVSEGTEEPWQPLSTFPRMLCIRSMRKSLSEEELTQLQTRCKFEDDDEWNYVIL